MNPAPDRPQPPPRHDRVTTCPVCQRSYTAAGRQTYCSGACRATAYRRRRNTAHPPVGSRPQSALCTADLPLGGLVGTTRRAAIEGEQRTESRARLCCPSPAGSE